MMARTFSHLILVLGIARSQPTVRRAKPPCHRVGDDSLSCTQGSDAASCAAEYAKFEDGACSAFDFKYCYKGAYGIEGWAKGDGASCAEGMKVLKNTGYANDGCGGKSAPLPCAASLVAAPPCHRLNGDSLTCSEANDVPACTAEYLHFEDGTCSAFDFKYCFFEPPGIQLWAKGDGASCAAGMKSLKITGLANDGCGGTTAPLPCNASLVAAPPCHRVNADTLSCTQGSDAASCAAEYAKFEDGACSAFDFKYCYKGAYGIELWAKGDGASCAEGMKVLKNTGYANDGCGGKTAHLPCAPLMVIL